MLARIRFILFFGLAVLTMPPVFLLSLIFRSKAHTMRGYWSRLQLFSVGIKVEVKNFPEKQNQMYIMNHRSWLDILVMEVVISRSNYNTNICWMGHSKLTKNIILKLLFKLHKFVVVERESRAGLVKLLRAVKKPIEENRPLMIFPEGTRNKKDGISTFKQGGKIIAQKNNITVRPVVLDHTDYFFDTKNLKMRSGVLEVIFLDEVDINKQEWLEELRDKMLIEYNKLPIREKI